MKKIISNLIAFCFLLNANSQVITNFPYLCEFEVHSDCRWFNAEDDDFDWLFSLNENRHVFVEFSIEQKEKQAWLEAIVDLRDVKKADITFIYKIQTNVSLASTSSKKNIKPGTLQLDINRGGEWEYNLWHDHSNGIKWKKQKIDLSEYCGELVVLSFTGYIEVPQSDICLDNILITGK